MERLPCTHKGTYADDCICERVKQHKCYIVATCDKDLRRRIRKVRAEKGTTLLPCLLYTAACLDCTDIHYVQTTIAQGL